MAAEIERGVAMVLSHRVALWLHTVDPVPASVPDFGLVGESEPIVRLRQEIQAAAQLDVPVLLRGETGTGKELAARALHRAGARRERPFVAVNMAVLTPSLAAAELFGAARGAYTGADRNKTGYFQRAEGGTLFLDEIGEVTPEVQTMLLRALENHEIPTRRQCRDPPGRRPGDRRHRLGSRGGHRGWTVPGSPAASARGL